MKNYLLILSALILTPAAAQAGCKAGTEGVCGNKKICVSNRITKQAQNDNNKCLQSKTPICQVLGKLAEIYKADGPIEIASADRSKNNAGRGGAKGSMHLTCRAADIFVPKVGPDRGSQTKLLARLKSIGISPMRYNIYPTGRTHIDNSSGLPNSYQSAVEGKNYGTWTRKRKY